MQDEVGTEEGQLIFEYDLPPGEMQDLAAYEDQLVTDAIDAVLESMDWIEVPLGSNSSLPAEVWEHYPELVAVETETEVVEHEIDWATERVVQVTRTKVLLEMAPTGNMLKRLKPGFELRDGRLYRKPTVDDIPVSAIRGWEAPALPDWVRLRVASKPLSQGIGPRLGAPTETAFSRGTESRIGQLSDRVKEREIERVSGRPE
jgi:hypothetical protein